MALRCTRIWCVRPVWIATCASVSSGRTARRGRCASPPRGCAAPAPTSSSGSPDRGRSARRCAGPPCTSPQTSAMYSFSTSRSWNCRGELLVRRVVLGDDHQSRRAAIEPVHDAGPLLAADAAQVVDVMEERVDERAARMPGGRVHDHAGRLVDDDEVAILVEDRQRQRFGLRHRIDRLRDLDRDRPGRSCTGWFGFRRAPADADVAVLDQPLNLRARLIGQHRRRGTDRGGRRRCRREP